MKLFISQSANAGKGVNMKVELTGSMLVIARHTKDGKDGKKYFSVAVDNGSESEDISCTEDVYNSVVIGKKNALVGQYNSQYKYFRFTTCGKDIL